MAAGQDLMIKMMMIVMMMVMITVIKYHTSLMIFFRKINAILT